MKLTWTVKFSVDSSWVEDGFDLTDERAFEMLQNDLSYATGRELRAKVISYPAALKVAKLQGYSNANEVLKVRKDGKL